MKTIRVIGVLGILLGLLVVSAAAQTVQSDFDRTFKFSNLKTFSFAIKKRATTDPLASDTLNDGRIRTGLETQLRTNGFRSETETPDFVIAYYVTSKNRLNVAISRAKWAAYLLYSPGLLDALPRRPDGVAQLSAFIRLVGADAPEAVAVSG